MVGKLTSLVTQGKQAQNLGMGPFTGKTGGAAILEREFCYIFFRLYAEVTMTPIVPPALPSWTS